MPQTQRKLNILVTGALGHIGSALIRSFPSSLVGNIILLDNLESQRYCSLFNLPKEFSYRFIEEDIRTADLNKHLQGIDVVIHLAALTNAEVSHAQKQEVESVNFDGLKRVANACLAQKIKLFFPSTTSVYGSQELRVNEECAELIPQSPYAESKLNAEYHLRDLKAKGLQFVTCRLGTIFGPSIGMRFHTAVNKFIWLASTGRPLTVWKTALRQKRPYLSLNDCLEATNFIIKHDIFNGEVYNILTENFTVENIITEIRNFIPDLNIDYVDSPIMNQLSYEVDDTKFRNLGFTPQGSLNEEIRNTINLLKGITK
ncbi:MAG: hypothetical protein A2102_01800 [Tenericutes bacterium GWF2_38_8]|nr:MAG: hypothetical protein A2102_01800 [Tenericutes bacterium GWF2_38_8]